MGRRITSFQKESSRSGAAYRHHQQSDLLATMNAPDCAATQEMIRAIVAGKINLGGRRKALLAIVTNAPLVSPARDNFSGLSAQT